MCSLLPFGVGAPCFVVTVSFGGGLRRVREDRRRDPKGGGGWGVVDFFTGDRSVEKGHEGGEG